MADTPGRSTPLRRGAALRSRYRHVRSDRSTLSPRNFRNHRQNLRGLNIGAALDGDWANLDVAAEERIVIRVPRSGKRGRLWRCFGELEKIPAKYPRFSLPPVAG